MSKNAPNKCSAYSSTLDQANCPERGNTITPSCGFPQKTSLPRWVTSADYATCRHAPRPKGEQRARGCVLWELRSALTRSAPVAPPRSERAPVVSKNASNKCSEITSPPRIGTKKPRYSDEGREKRLDTGARCTWSYISGRVKALDKAIRRIARFFRSRGHQAVSASSPPL